MISDLLNRKVNISKELIDTYKCRFMGIVNTYDITLEDKDFKYTKSILHKEFGGASVLPVDKGGNVYLEIQYRFPLRQTIIELPAGRSEEGETFLDCAKRELKEETGCISNSIIHQTDIYAQPDFTDEKLGSFLATECDQIGEQDLDSDETVKVIKMPYESAIDLVKENIIKDERTIVALGISRCIQNVRFSKPEENKEEFVEKIIKKLKDEEENLIEKDVGIDYTETCEFGVIQDHIVVVPGNKNSRRECFYLQSGDIVLPVSKKGKFGFFVRYMPAVNKNLIQLPTKVEIEEDCEIKEFGEMITAVGYANDRQYMFLAEEMEETEDYVWVTREEALEYIETGLIEDGRVMAILLKYLM